MSARLIFLAGLAALPFAAPAAAHSWYDPECCSGRDCAPVPDASVQAMADGYHVSLMPGDHPLVRWPLREVIPYGDPRINWSQDERMHVCVSTGPNDQQGILCIYVKGAGA